MPRSLLALALLASVLPALGSSANAGKSPVDHLPPYIKHLTHFGERADWSHDGKKILFLTKMFGDAMEFDLASGHIRNLTAYYPHHGYTRAMYLANGDILLSGPETFDPKQAVRARRECYLSVLARDGKSLPVPLGALCSEGPAISRTTLQVAWTEWGPTPPGSNLASSTMYAAEIAYTGGKPAFVNRRRILDGSEPGFPCTMEVQNFRPGNERELIFNTYMDGGQKCDVFSVDLETKKLTRFTDSPAIYDEAEGVFPDGAHTLVECDVQRPGGPANIDLWKLALDGTARQVRLTHFSDFPGYKSSNGVVSEDGRYMAFQMGRAGDAPGIGHGVFVLDLSQVPTEVR
ncbi:MAG TPA: hypothetical protein VHN79_09530 [Lacunisphaera sp.]|nr:hypothetical protein [Lacunisphaera sp.]